MRPVCRLRTLCGGVLIALLLLLALPLAAETIAVTAPGTLDQAGATYALANDVSAAGTAFTIAANGITFDLGGHAITYNTAPQGAPAYGIVIRVTMDGSPMVIRNGSIIQGAGADTYANAIQDTHGDCQNLEITGIHTTVCGNSAHSVSLMWCRGGLNIHHNTFTSNITQIVSRMAYDGYAVSVAANRGGALPSAISHNTINGGHGGIVVDGPDMTISDNDIGHRSLGGNGFGVLLSRSLNVSVVGNSIHSEDGCGILVDTEFANVDVSGNTIDIQQAPNGDSGHGWGVKIRSYTATPSWDDLLGVIHPTGNCRVHDNMITVRTGDGLLQAAGIGIYDSVPDMGNRYYDNQITAVTTSPSARAFGLALTGKQIDNAGTEVFGNTITSNNYNMEWNDSDGAGPNGVVFTSNTLVKGSPIPGVYHTVRVGLGDAQSLGHTLLDTRVQDGASISDIYRAGNARVPPMHSFLVKWFLDLTVRDAAGGPVPDAQVTAAGDGENVSGTTDDAGRVRLALTQYLETGSSQVGSTTPPVLAYATPHTITIRKGGYQEWSQSLTMDATKSLEATLASSSTSAVLSVGDSLDEPGPLPGEVVTYTVPFVNTTSTTVQAATVSHPIPAHTTYVPGSACLNGVPITPDPYADGAISVFVGSIAPGEGGVITFRVTVD